MTQKAEVREIKNYFSVHMFLLKWSGIRLEPFPENIVRKCLIIFASVLFVIMCPLLYVVGEALEAPNLELEQLTYNLSYCITHSLGMYVLKFTTKSIFLHCLIRKQVL